jgi:phage gp16-like protein
MRATEARRATFDCGDQDRRVMIAKVHVAKKELGLLDDDYRAMLIRVTGKPSSAQCSPAELRALLDEMKAKGFKAKPATGRRGGAAAAADHPVARKARALWVSLHHLGAIANPSEQALEAFARRQLKVAKLQWADQAQGYKLIEALKAIGERNGWSFKSTWNDGRQPSVKVLKVRLVERLQQLLTDAGIAPVSWTLRQLAWHLAGMEREGPVPFWSESDLDLLARALGDKLREARS